MNALQGERKAPLELHDAVNYYVGFLDRQRAEEEAAYRLRCAERDERCAQVATAVAWRILRDERVATYEYQWSVNEVESGSYFYYGAVLNLDAPGRPLDSDDGPISGVCISNLSADGSTAFQRKFTNGEWTAWHKCNSGRSFKSFLAAITFAMTGRQ